MCKQKQNAVKPETNQEYQIEYPCKELIRQAIFELDYPDEGLRVKDAVIALTDKFELSDEQKNAVNRSNLNVFRHSVVAPHFRQLLQKGKLLQPNGPKTPYFLAENGNINVCPIEKVKRKAVDSNGEEYEIEIPATHVVKNALLEFEYPSQGIRNKDVADTLAVQFELTDEVVNAKHRNGFKIFLNHVNIAVRALVKSEKLLKIRRGWIINPHQFEEITPCDTPSSGEDTPSPEVVIERKYREIQKNLEMELLQKIKDNPPDFFEELVLDLLFEMGYGGSRADVEVVGQSGDEGIDGIIRADPLGLNVIYVQAKRWEGNVGEPPVRDFVGALDLKGAPGGFFITTSDFNQKAKDVAKKSSKQVILINGKKFAQLMIEHNVGVYDGKTYQLKEIDTDYFREVEEE